MRQFQLVALEEAAVVVYNVEDMLSHTCSATGCPRYYEVLHRDANEGFPSAGHVWKWYGCSNSGKHFHEKVTYIVSRVPNQHLITERSHRTLVCIGYALYIFAVRALFNYSARTVVVSLAFQTCKSLHIVERVNVAWCLEDHLVNRRFEKARRVAKLNKSSLSMCKAVS